MATDANNSGDPNANKVTFDAAQQARVDEIIREAQGRAGAAAKADALAATTRADQLATELAQAKADLASAKTSTQKKDAKEDVDALNSKIAEMESVRVANAAEVDRLRKITADKDKEIADAKNQTKSVRKQVALQSAAEKCGFVSVSQVTRLTGDSISVDDAGNFVVLNEAGAPRLNNAYNPMSLDEYYAEFASQNPHLVRGDVKGGTGSSQAARTDLSGNGKYAAADIFGAKSNAKLANELAKTDIKEYRRLKVVAKEAGLINY